MIEEELMSILSHLNIDNPPNTTLSPESVSEISKVALTAEEVKKGKAILGDQQRMVEGEST